MPNKKEVTMQPTTGVSAAVHGEAVVETERVQFKRLMLGNPNYFGTLPNSLYPPVKQIIGNTTYEQLRCVGLHPEGNRLEAVIDIKRHSGYLGGACSAGSREYVRFYIQHPDGWHDLGTSAITVYDMPSSPLPVSYSVAKDITEARHLCRSENILNVRAILAWNHEPPPNMPNYIPPWGNVVNSRVQIAKRNLRVIPIGELIAEKEITIDPALLSAVNLETTLDTLPVQPLNFAQLQIAYAQTDVPAHRYGFVAAQKLLAQPLSLASVTLAANSSITGEGNSSNSNGNPQSGSSPTVALAKSPLATTLQIGPQLEAILQGILKTSGDTTYEELTCAGYNPQTRTLAGAITIKRNSGYSGSLCGAGSTEYVGFWVQYAGSWHALGGASVDVHDLAGVGTGVQYAVFRVSNLPEKLCQDIAGLPLRAILSWQTPPTGPNFVPVWGNIVNTHVQPPIGQPGTGDKPHARLQRVGEVTINGIAANGRANPTGFAGDCVGNDSPFGGTINIEGDFTVKPNVFDPNTGDVLPGTHPLLYQMFFSQISPVVTPFVQIVEPFTIGVFPTNGFLPVSKNQAAHLVTDPVIGGAPGDHYFTYMESDTQAATSRILSVWPAGGLSEGLYQLKLKGFAWNGAAYDVVSVQSQNVYIYNGAPILALHLTSPSTDCGDITVGQTVQGTFSVVDHFLGEFDIALFPITIGGNPAFEPGITLVSGGNPQPNPTIYQDTPEAVTMGMSGNWSLDTSGMSPCGYTIRLRSTDRALVSNTCSGHPNETGVGFCLRQG